MTKKLIICVVLALLVFSSLLMGCTTQEGPGKEVRLIWGDGPAGTTLILAAEALGEAIRKENPGYDVVIAAGDSIPNRAFFLKGQLDLTNQHHPILTLVDEQRKNPDAKLFEAYSIAFMNTACVQFVVNPSTGITSIPDLIAKKYPLKVAVATQGSTPNYVNQLVFEAFGANFSDIEAWGGELVGLTFTPGWAQYEDGILDAVWQGASYPNPWLTSTRKDFSILPIPWSEVGDKLAPLGFTPFTIEKETYNMKEDIPSVFTSQVIVCSGDMDEEVAYNIARAIVTQRDSLVAISGEFEYVLSPEGMQTVDRDYYPLHPGAKKYYQEIGWLP